MAFSLLESLRIAVILISLRNSGTFPSHPCHYFSSILNTLLVFGGLSISFHFKLQGSRIGHLLVPSCSHCYFKEARGLRRQLRGKNILSIPFTSAKCPCCFHYFHHQLYHPHWLPILRKLTKRKFAVDIYICIYIDKQEEKHTN